MAKPKICLKSAPLLQPTTALKVVAAPMVTRWSQKSPGLKILWIWTLGTAAIMITNVVRTRVNDMQMILREEDEAVGSGGGGTGGGPSGERVMRDDELN
ncbi:hypothetical protein TRIUR3_33814 [Triticum urartu]|uniref:Uncharacterized protein n=4 Tax=Triticum TaxID=4564 RepID=M7Y962_TRIUA|nr:hypothetical protein TRIUR3_33814 [Triticum urartu]